MFHHFLIGKWSAVQLQNQEQVGISREKLPHLSCPVAMNPNVLFFSLHWDPSYLYLLLTLHLHQEESHRHHLNYYRDCQFSLVEYSCTEGNWLFGKWKRQSVQKRGWLFGFQKYKWLMASSSDFLWWIVFYTLLFCAFSLFLQREILVIICLWFEWCRMWFI